MSKELIAVDVDEVLFPFVQEFVGFHNERYLSGVTPQDFLNYEFEEVLNISIPEAMERIFAFHNMDDLHIEPLSEAQEALGKLSIDYDLQIITARDPRFERSTKAWVKKNFEGVFSDVFLIGHPAAMEKPQTKAALCREIGAFAMVDDSVKHVSSCAEVGVEGVLFGDYPWNQVQPMPAGVTRCIDWSAVREYFDVRT